MEWARIKRILTKTKERWILEVEIDGQRSKAILYPLLSGEAAVGERVLLNTTAVELKLGTGGYHFVLSIAGKEEKELPGAGHIMKLRYTPYQVKVHCREEQGPFTGGKLPTAFALSLHSMLAPLAIVLKHFNQAKIAYIMTDAGALPIWFSDSVRLLKEKQLLDLTITAGHAFGGDLETVNVYTAILAAAEAGCTFAIIGPGPGHVGTASQWGFSGIEQGEVLNAAALLGCRTIGIPRLSFKDKRVRHRGISHHSLTALGVVCRVKAEIFLPQLGGKKGRIIEEQIRRLEQRDVKFLNPRPVKRLLQAKGEYLNMMGRSFYQDPLYFITCALGGWGAGHYR